MQIAKKCHEPLLASAPGMDSFPSAQNNGEQIATMTGDGRNINKDMLDSAMRQVARSALLLLAPSPSVLAD